MVERLKGMTLGKWCALYCVVAFIVQVVFLILKWTGAVTWSWHTVLYPAIITEGLVAIAAVFIGFAIMTINAEEKAQSEKNELEE